MNKRDNKKSYKKILKIKLVLLCFLPLFTLGQQKNSDSLLARATVEECIRYAIQHNPDIKFAKINEQIIDATIKGKLADWYPQLNLNYNFQHNFQLPTVNFNGSLIHTGLENTSGAQFGATQNIFNRDVLLASRSSRDVRLQASQTTKQQDINIAAQVAKAFYDIILTMQQIRVTMEDIHRIELSLKDAYARYQSGIVDKTDYKRATISLNNAKAQLNTGQLNLLAKYALLKQLMSYPADNNLTIVYDTLAMSNDIFIDTLQKVNFDNRIEIQLLQTQRKLQQYNLQYYKWSYLPTISGFANYNFVFQNNTFTKVYSQNFPNSYAGVLLSLPIFQGGKKIQQIRQAQLQLEQVDYSIASFQNRINTQYQQALASYKSNLYNYYSLKENLALAQEVYAVIELQYRAGIKTYLEVINAETDLRDAQINYYNALNQVLSSRVDVQQALGTIVY